MKLKCLLIFQVFDFDFVINFVDRISNLVYVNSLHYYLHFYLINITVMDLRRISLATTISLLWKTSIMRETVSLKNVTTSSIPIFKKKENSCFTLFIKIVSLNESIVCIEFKLNTNIYIYISWFKTNLKRFK